MNRQLLSLAVTGVLFLASALPCQAAIAPKRSVLANGLVLLSSEQNSLPMITFELLIDAGSRYDLPSREGLANMTARLLTYGTKRRTALQISDSLDFLGANLSAGCDEDSVSIRMTVLKKDLGTGLQLMAEILTSATFPRDEIDRQKQSVLAGIKAREEDPGDIALRKFAAALFPESPYGRAVEGTEASVKAIEQKSLRAFYQQHYHPNRSIMSVVGDISHEEIARALQQSLREWKKGETPAPPSAPRRIGGPQMISVNKDLMQANIILGHLGVARDNPDYYAIQVMNYILGGGGFSSRAMDAIRNERGLAYSVYSYFSAERSHGTFQFVLQTKNETVQEALRMARAEILRIREHPVTDQELADAKDYLTGSFAIRLDTNRKLANFLAQVEYFRLGLDYPERYTALIKNVSRNDVQRAAQHYLHPDKLITVIVGNEKKFSQN